MFSGNIFSQEMRDNISIHLKNYTPVITAQIISITPDFYNSQLGIICKKEWLVEKNIKIPFRFRLGSLDYVNKLEGKKN